MRSATRRYGCDTQRLLRAKEAAEAKDARRAAEAAHDAVALAYFLRFGAEDPVSCFDACCASLPSRPSPKMLRIAVDKSNRPLSSR